MGILIEGMEMPKSEPLLVKINPDASVSTTAKNSYKKYEAVSVPEPHGRLIDESEFFSCIERGIQTISALPLPKDFVELYMQLINDIKTESMKCHTVIPASEEA